MGCWPRTSNVVLTLLFTYALSPVAVACDCLAVRLVTEDLLDRYDAVFLGQLVSQEPDYEPVYVDPADPEYEQVYRSINLRVLQSWKGVTGREVGIVTEPGGSFAGCGLWGYVGDRFLVFANTLPDDGRLAVPGCAGARIIGDVETVGIASLALTEGDDPLYPPLELRNGGLCGAGILSGLGISVAGLLLLAFRP